MIKKQKIVYYNNTAYDLELKPSQIEGAGLGVYSKQFIPAETFLGYYEGHWNHDPKTASNYSYYINSRTLIDIDLTDIPYTAMFNDAFRTEFRNSVASHILVPDEIVQKIRAKNSHKYDPDKFVGMYTTRDIMPGDEMFFDYGAFYWTGW